MKFYDCVTAPSPRRVRIFLAEKGISIETVQVDLRNGEQFGAAFRAINPDSTVPVLVLDSGAAITDIVAICRYLEELHPEPNLFGRDAKERATIDMWIRRVEFRLMMPVGQIWVHTHPFTATVATKAFGQQFKEFGAANRNLVDAACRLFDEELGGRGYVASERYTMADIVAQTTFDFAPFAPS